MKRRGLCLRAGKIEYISALSLDQPFAHLICHFGMNVESRRWTTKRRGTIAIHATAKRSAAEFDWVAEQFGICLKTHDVDFSAVIGLAEIIDVITEDEVTKKTEKWFIGPYGFVLKNIITLPSPVWVKGNRKFWRLKGEPLTKVLSQLSPLQRNSLKPFVLQD